ncbi:hypothetical protein BG36_07605 [Aquamicrobium defluvii]|uniref:Uncharacterized protein n=1 Tax=Aquamicrobium defluvii TaxID=69279 RepID=A0A011UVZ1_9HYPH|nr:hypothetical protein BG36_07605 [Aquamicrobium defluvii]EZQ16797.1 hypothetical protein CF98_37160 [Halopseudomonas bauzanensis]
MSRAASILDRAISPSEAVEILWKRGVEVSERTLKERAREIGAYRQIGRAIFFTPDDLERIMEPPACSPSPSAPRARIGSHGVRSTVSDLNEARAKLQSLRQGKNSRR